tara:strand:+ start:337 stop:498 length:162 start_codon:yes stop_codon:yes gene_type:complete
MGAKRLFAFDRARSRESHVVAEVIEHRRSGRLHLVHMNIRIPYFGAIWRGVGW